MKKTSLIPSLTFCLLSGCTPIKVTPPKLSIHPFTRTVVMDNVKTATPDIYDRPLEVVHYDRYLLASTDPVEEQRDMLSQFIDIRIPPSLKPNVGDAMTYVLRQTGFSLCLSNASANLLYQHPLPAIHYQLGPMRLRTALQILAGPAWILEIDDVKRTVCHSLRASYQLPKTEVKAPHKPIFGTLLALIPASSGGLLNGAKE
ncbi:PilL N-terminal domain-containing protein [Rouxiella badensis]|uniref:PFGI-1 class ICE element type IV pilus protein PilL2 n=1 Tax=Rouxiella badensis TaxID=1646377 RepID=UPI001D14DEBD|nr:PilL N-terminal domain-containing protein [Rouxiella badensis]MCC3701653.1 PilL N-terminal domain-containing protein [Rouxiella badensis]